MFHSPVHGTYNDQATSTTSYMRMGPDEPPDMYPGIHTPGQVTVDVHRGPMTSSSGSGNKYEDTISTSSHHYPFCRPTVPKGSSSPITSDYAIVQRRKRLPKKGSSEVGHVSSQGINGGSNHVYINTQCQCDEKTESEASSCRRSDKRSDVPRTLDVSLNQDLSSETIPKMTSVLPRRPNLRLRMPTNIMLPNNTLHHTPCAILYSPGLTSRMTQGLEERTPESPQQPVLSPRGPQLCHESPQNQTFQQETPLKSPMDKPSPFDTQLKIPVDQDQCPPLPPKSPTDHELTPKSERPSTSPAVTKWTPEPRPKGTQDPKDPNLFFRPSVAQDIPPRSPSNPHVLASRATRLGLKVSSSLHQVPSSSSPAGHQPSASYPNLSSPDQFQCTPSPGIKLNATGPSFRVNHQPFHPGNHIPRHQDNIILEHSQGTSSIHLWIWILFLLNPRMF